MAKKSWIVKSQKEPKFSVRHVNRCSVAVAAGRTCGNSAFAEFASASSPRRASFLASRKSSW